MRTDQRLRPAGRRLLLLGLLAAAGLRAEPTLPEVVEPAARPDLQPGLQGEAAADTGWPLDETVFTDIEAFTVPAVPIALPEDQAEE